MERYLCPLLLGFGFFALWLIVEAPPKKLSTLWKPLPAVLAALGTLVLALSLNWGALFANTWPDTYYQRIGGMGIETEVMMDHDWGTALEGYENAHVLVGLESNSTYPKNLRYVYAPIRFALPDPSFSESSEALADYLLENHITHLICFDETNLLYEPASQLIPDDYLYPWTLYEVVPQEDGLTLEEFY